MRIAYEKERKRYNLRARPIAFALGDIVYRRNFQLSNKAIGFSAKLAPKFVEGIVSKIVGSNINQIKDADTGTMGTYHAKDLKKD